MDLSRIIVGPVVTEKAERQKMERTYTLRVMPGATKVDVKKALKQYFDVDASSVRIQKVGSKVRALGAGKEMTKRKAYKKAVITITEDSAALDLTKFKGA